MPAMMGRMKPIVPTAMAIGPTLSRSSRRTSRPTVKSRMTTPSSAKTSAVSGDVGEAEGEGPDDEAAEQLTDDAGLVDASEDLFADLGREEEDEQAEQRVREGRRPLRRRRQTRR